MCETNITERLRGTFEDLISGQATGRTCLYSCFVNGEPTSAICSVVPIRDGSLVEITPMFVAITPGMRLSDHDGVSPTENGGEPADVDLDSDLAREMCLREMVKADHRFERAMIAVLKGLDYLVER